MGIEIKTFDQFHFHLIGPSIRKLNSDHEMIASYELTDLGPHRAPAPLILTGERQNLTLQKGGPHPLLLIIQF